MSLSFDGPAALALPLPIAITLALELFDVFFEISRSLSLSRSVVGTSLVPFTSTVPVAVTVLLGLDGAPDGFTTRPVPVVSAVAVLLTLPLGFAFVIPGAVDGPCGGSRSRLRFVATAVLVEELEGGPARSNIVAGSSLRLLVVGCTDNEGADWLGVERGACARAGAWCIGGGAGVCVDTLTGPFTVDVVLSLVSPFFATTDTSDVDLKGAACGDKMLV